MSDSYGEEWFNQKSLQMGSMWVCYYQPESKRESIKLTYADSPVKKKFCAQIFIVAGMQVVE